MSFKLISHQSSVIKTEERKREIEGEGGNLKINRCCLGSNFPSEMEFEALLEHQRLVARLMK